MWTLRLLALALAGVALQAQQTGDPAKGKVIFEGKGTCSSCHRINGSGSHFGPDLSEIGARRPGSFKPRYSIPMRKSLPPIVSTGWSR